MPYFNTTAAWCGQAVPLFPAGHVQIPAEQSTVYIVFGCFLLGTWYWKGFLSS